MFENITNQLLAFKPELVYLFGSQAKGTATDKSDIDICLIINTDNKRKLTAQLYYEVECDKAIDFIVYTPEEWQCCIEDSTSFAHKVLTEGVRLYG